MKLSVALLLATASAVSARKNVDLSNVDLKADSKVGNRLLSKARRLDNNANEVMTWVAGYSLKFHSCVASQDYYGGYFANNEENNANQYNDYADGYNYNGNYNGNGDGQNYNYNGGYYNGGNQNANNYQGMYEQRLVHFQLCPSNSCRSCKNGADYVIGLNEYINAHMEAKLTAQEYNCEKVRENCYCDNAYSEEQCLYQCYKNAGLTSCVVNEEQQQQQEEEFNLQEALECTQLEFDEEALETYNYQKNYNRANKNQGQYYNEEWYDQQQQQQEDAEFFVGPYCSANGKKIFLGVFTEETCSFPAESGLYEALHYGTSLPYAKESLVDYSCISCKEPSDVDYNNYWDAQDEDEVTEVCETLYADAGKCEENLGGGNGYFPYRNNLGCNFIKSLKTPSIFSRASSNVPAKVFAGIFAATTALLGAFAIFTFKRSKRQNVSLASESSMIA